MKFILIFQVTLCIFIKNTVLAQDNFDLEKVRNSINTKLILKRELEEDSVHYFNSKNKLICRYIGFIKNGKNKYHFVNSTYIFNILESPTAESTIILYDSNLKIYGYYSISNSDLLPKRIKNNLLLFDIKSEQLSR